jgi:hypothetical protein
VQENAHNFMQIMQAADKNDLLRQRKVLITPTLIKYTQGHEEESNRVIRKFKTLLPNFIRLAFVNEDNEKGYYFNGDGC